MQQAAEMALRSCLSLASIALLACFVAAIAKFFFMCVEVFVSVDGLCPEEGFKGVWVSRSIVVVVLVGF